MGAIVDALDADLRLMARRLQNRALVENRRAAPVKTRALQDSLKTSSSYIAGRLTVTIESPLVQGATTNTGARPHVILPRFARALRFQMRGRTVFARRVNHPGNRGTHWFDHVNERGWPLWVADELNRLG